MFFLLDQHQFGVCISNTNREAFWTRPGLGLRHMVCIWWFVLVQIVVLEACLVWVVLWDQPFSLWLLRNLLLANIYTHLQYPLCGNLPLCWVKMAIVCLSATFSLQDKRTSAGLTVVPWMLDAGVNLWSVLGWHETALHSYHCSWSWWWFSQTELKFNPPTHLHIASDWDCLATSCIIFFSVHHWVVEVLAKGAQSKGGRCSQHHPEKNN